VTGPDGFERRTYITEVSVPTPGDGGVQRLCSRMREPEPLPEAEPPAEVGADAKAELEAGI
jgi:hypothetical protein